MSERKSTSRPSGIARPSRDLSKSSSFLHTPSISSVNNTGDNAYEANLTNTNNNKINTKPILRKISSNKLLSKNSSSNLLSHDTHPTTPPKESLFPSKNSSDLFATPPVNRKAKSIFSKDPSTTLTENLNNQIKLSDQWIPNEGEIVWVRTSDTLPFAPACVCPSDILTKSISLRQNKISPKNRKYTVYLYGTDVFDFVTISQMKSFKENKSLYSEQEIPVESKLLFDQALKFVEIEEHYDNNERILNILKKKPRYEDELEKVDTTNKNQVNNFEEKTSLDEPYNSINKISSDLEYKVNSTAGREYDEFSVLSDVNADHKLADVDWKADPTKNNFECSNNQSYSFGIQPINIGENSNLDPILSCSIGDNIPVELSVIVSNKDSDSKYLTSPCITIHNDESSNLGSQSINSREHFHLDTMLSGHIEENTLVFSDKVTESKDFSSQYIPSNAIEFVDNSSSLTSSNCNCVNNDSYELSVTHTHNEHNLTLGNQHNDLINPCLDGIESIKCIEIDDSDLTLTTDVDVSMTTVLTNSIVNEYSVDFSANNFGNMTTAVDNPVNVTQQSHDSMLVTGEQPSNNCSQCNEMNMIDLESESQPSSVVMNEIEESSYKTSSGTHISIQKTNIINLDETSNIVPQKSKVILKKNSSRLSDAASLFVKTSNNADSPPTQTMFSSQNDLPRVTQNVFGNTKYSDSKEVISKMSTSDVSNLFSYPKQSNIRENDKPELSINSLNLNNSKVALSVSTRTIKTDASKLFSNTSTTVVNDSNDFFEVSLKSQSVSAPASSSSSHVNNLRTEGIVEISNISDNKESYNIGFASSIRSNNIFADTSSLISHVSDSSDNHNIYTVINYVQPVDNGTSSNTLQSDLSSTSSLAVNNLNSSSDNFSFGGNSSNEDKPSILDMPKRTESIPNLIEIRTTIPEIDNDTLELKTSSLAGVNDEIQNLQNCIVDSNVYSGSVTVENNELSSRHVETVANSSDDNTSFKTFHKEITKADLPNSAVYSQSFELMSSPPSSMQSVQSNDWVNISLSEVTDLNSQSSDHERSIVETSTKTNANSSSGAMSPRVNNGRGSNAKIISAKALLKQDLSPFSTIANTNDVDLLFSSNSKAVSFPESSSFKTENDKNKNLSNYFDSIPHDRSNDTYFPLENLNSSHLSTEIDRSVSMPSNSDKTDLLQRNIDFDKSKNIPLIRSENLTKFSTNTSGMVPQTIQGINQPMSSATKALSTENSIKPTNNNMLAPPTMPGIKQPSQSSVPIKNSNFVKNKPVEMVLSSHGYIPMPAGVVRNNIPNSTAESAFSTGHVNRDAPKDFLNNHNSILLSDIALSDDKIKPLLKTSQVTSSSNSSTILFNNNNNNYTNSSEAYHKTHIIGPQRGCPLVSFGFNGKIAVVVPRKRPHTTHLNLASTLTDAAIHILSVMNLMKEYLSNLLTSTSHNPIIFYNNTALKPNSDNDLVTREIDKRHYDEISCFIDILTSFPGPLVSPNKPNDIKQDNPKLTQMTNSISKYIQKYVDSPVSSKVPKSYFAVNGNFVGSQSSLISSERTLWIILQLLTKNFGAVSSADASSAGKLNSPELSIIQALLDFVSNSTVETSANVPISNSADIKSLYATFQNQTFDKHDDEAYVSIENFLLVGDREKALEVAVANKIWPIALIISSICGPETYQTVIREYTESRLPKGLPLSLLFHIYSNQGNNLMKINKSLYQSTKSTNIPSNLSMHWRRNLSAILSNKGRDWDTLTILLGDKILEETKDIFAAHISYLTGQSFPRSPKQLNFGNSSTAGNTNRYCLIGCDLAHAVNHNFSDIYSMSSLRMTEILEFSLSMNLTNSLQSATINTAKSSIGMDISGLFGFSKNETAKVSSPSSVALPISQEQLMAIKVAIVPIKLRLVYLLCDYGLLNEALEYCLFIKDIISYVGTIGGQALSSSLDYANQSHKGFSKRFLKDLDDIFDRLSVSLGKHKISNVVLHSTAGDNTPMSVSSNDSKGSWGLTSIVSALSSSKLKEFVDGGNEPSSVQLSQVPSNLAGAMPPHYPNTKYLSQAPRSSSGSFDPGNTQKLLNNVFSTSPMNSAPNSGYNSIPSAPGIRPIITTSSSQNLASDVSFSNTLLLQGTPGDKNYNSSHSHLRKTENSDLTDNDIVMPPAAPGIKLSNSYQNLSGNAVNSFQNMPPKPNSNPNLVELVESDKGKNSYTMFLPSAPGTRSHVITKSNQNLMESPPTSGNSKMNNNDYLFQPNISQNSLETYESENYNQNSENNSLKNKVSTDISSKQFNPATNEINNNIKSTSIFSAASKSKPSSDQNLSNVVQNADYTVTKPASSNDNSDINSNSSKEQSEKLSNNDLKRDKSKVKSSGNIGLIGKARKGLLSWIYPDAVDANDNLGQGLEAYFDKKLNKWIFPGEEDKGNDDAASAPPPTNKNVNGELSTQTNSSNQSEYDPLASLMAPPSRSIPNSSSSNKIDDPMTALLAPPVRRMPYSSSSVPSLSNSNTTTPSMPSTFKVWQPPRVSNTNSTASTFLANITVPNIESDSTNADNALASVDLNDTEIDSRNENNNVDS